MQDIQFDSLGTYITLAKKTINKFGGNIAKEMLKNEDAISDIAQAIMIGDWRWDENRTGKTGQKKSRYSYRNQCAIWAIQTYMTKKYKKKKSCSLDFSKDEDSIHLKDSIPSPEKDPCSILIDNETQRLLNEDVSAILNSELLSDKQREYIKLYYFEGQTLEKIGKRFNITREAVRQNINKAIKNIQNLLNV